MTLLSRFRSLFTPRPLGPGWLGLVVNDATPEDLLRLHALAKPNRMPLVRTTNNGDHDSGQRVMRLAAEDFPLLVTLPFGKGFGPIGPGMALQIDDEPDRQSPSVSPEHYGGLFRSTMQAMRQSLPSAIPIVTAGFSSTASVEWIARALRAGAGDADAICFHVDGEDLAEAFPRRLAVLMAALEVVGCSDKPLWVTKVGYTSARGHAAQAAQIGALLKLKSLRRWCARVYVSSLVTDFANVLAAGDDGLCAHDFTRTPRPSFDVVARAMLRR